MPAVRAIPQMGADLATTRDPSVGIGENPYDRLATQAAPEVHLLEVAARLIEGLANDRAARAEGRPDVGEVEPAQLAHDQDRPLPRGQIAEVPKQPLQSLALLSPFRDVRLPVEQLPVECLGLALRAAQVDRLVVGDPVEPRPQRYLPFLTRQRPQCLDHRVLQSVLGVLRFAEQAQAEPIELLLVALEDRPQRLLVPARRVPGESLVRASPQRPL